LKSAGHNEMKDKGKLDLKTSIEDF
jgi:hypothetical protein